LCTATLALNFRNIDRTIPYPQHVDEPAVATAAARMLTDNTLHPSTFNYPSLPKYIAAGGMALGFLSELTYVDQIGSVGFPYYTAHRPMLFARTIFAAIAALTLVLTGWAAWLMTRSAVAIALAPLVLAVSPLFAYHSWVYLNVDIVAALFVTATIVALLLDTERPSVSQLGIVPGLLTGLAIGSKYTHAVTLVPVLLTIAFYAPVGMRLRATLGAIGAMAAAFLAVMPYSILDLIGFLNGRLRGAPLRDRPSRLRRASRLAAVAVLPRTLHVGVWHQRHHPGARRHRRARFHPNASSPDASVAAGRDTGHARSATRSLHSERAGAASCDGDLHRFGFARHAGLGARLDPIPHVVVRQASSLLPSSRSSSCSSPSWCRRHISATCSAIGSIRGMSPRRGSPSASRTTGPS
jgi:hypothetical protein